MNEITNGATVKNYRNVLHISLTKLHLSKYSGVIICEGKPLHEKEFFCDVRTRVLSLGKFGKCESSYYLNEKGSPMFDSFEKLVEHYNN